MAFHRGHLNMFKGANGFTLISKTNRGSCQVETTLGKLNFENTQRKKLKEKNVTLRKAEILTLNRNNSILITLVRSL